MEKSLHKAKIVCLRVLPWYVGIVFWEFMTYILCHGELTSLRPFFLLFAVPQALFLAAVNCWLSNHIVNRIVNTLLALGLLTFYFSQMFYYRIFGSLYSISMLGMGGDAIADFGFALLPIAAKSIGWIILFLLPAIAIIWMTWAKKLPTDEETRKGNHILVLLLVLTWMGTTNSLALFGTDDGSAYSACFDSYTDTDTTSTKLGALTCSMLEGGVKVVDYSKARSGNSEQLYTNDSFASVDLAPVELNPVDKTVKVEAEELEETLETVEIKKELDTSPNIFQSIDFEMLAQQAPTKVIRELCNYYASVAPTCKNEFTGMFEGYNLILICGESFSNFAVDEVVTPTLYKMSKEGIVLENYYNSFKNTTTNGEFALLTGIWPDVSRDADNGSSTGTMAQSAGQYLPMGLGTMFKSIGATARGYHNYKGSYYNRENSWANLGLDCTFAGEGGMSFSSSWPASDLEMMEQSVDDYIDDNQFCVYYMTFSGHGPYDKSNKIATQNLSYVSELVEERNYKYSYSTYYLAANRELDLAMEYLLQRLEKAGKIENTVIVLAGDHFPYYLFTGGLIDFFGYIPTGNFETYKSTCIIWNGSIKEPIVVDDYCCNVDIYPTLMNLFNIPYESRLLAGKDIFADTTHAAILYNRNFMTDKLSYIWSGGMTTWSINKDDYSANELKSYVDYLRNYVGKNYSNSVTMMKTQFFDYVWTYSGLKTQ